MYKEVLEKYGVKQTPELTFKIILYELGMVMKNEVYAERFGPKAYLGDKKYETADLLTMIGLLNEQGWPTPQQLGDLDLPSLTYKDFLNVVRGIEVRNSYYESDLEIIGLERFEHRISEVKIEILKRKALDRE